MMENVIMATPFCISLSSNIPYNDANVADADAAVRCKSHSRSDMSNLKF